MSIPSCVRSLPHTSTSVQLIFLVYFTVQSGRKWTEEMGVFWINHFLEQIYSAYVGRKRENAKMSSDTRCRNSARVQMERSFWCSLTKNIPNSQQQAACRHWLLEPCSHQEMPKASASGSTWREGVLTALTVSCPVTVLLHGSSSRSDSV